MSRIYLLPETAHEYKGNFHTHTTRSDGYFTPEQVREMYKANGYSVVVYTDHWNYSDSSYLSEDDFLALSGYELNYDLRDPATNLVYKTCHINAIARDPKHVTPIEGKGLYELNGINDAIRRLNEGGFVVNLNHAAWSNMPASDIAAVEGVVGMELFNSTCVEGFEGMGELYAYMQTIRDGKRVLPLATDDTHHGAFYNGAPMPTKDGCQAFLMLRADHLTYDEILNAYLSGHYYCSNGPVIHSAYIENDKVIVDCSPVRAGFLKTCYVNYHRKEIRPWDTLTHFEFDLKDFKHGPFIMIQLVDSMGRFAATVPYYFD
ncbi:MAG: hypothetical protein MJ099_01445 [Clostridia bacterium]|nr:hypothetical protein [Clostridia bacterium]